MNQHTYKSFPRDFKAGYRGTKTFRRITRAQNHRARVLTKILLRERIYDEDVNYNVILGAVYN